MSKGERNRLKVRVRTAMAAESATGGQFLGGRPPYGCRLVDAGPHVNRERQPPADGCAWSLIRSPHPSYGASTPERIRSDVRWSAGFETRDAGHRRLLPEDPGQADVVLAEATIGPLAVAPQARVWSPGANDTIYERRRSSVLTE